MRRATVIGVTLLSIATAVLIAVGAYQAGMHHAALQTTSGQIVRVVGPGFYGGGWGFFPFGFLLFPLFFFGFILLLRGLFWSRHWGGSGGPGGYGRGHDWGEKGRMFEDWHRRQHEQGSGDHTPAGGEPSPAA